MTGYSTKCNDFASVIIRVGRVQRQRNASLRYCESCEAASRFPRIPLAAFRLRAMHCKTHPDPMEPGHETPISRNHSAW
ncbi:hypothetical protein Cenrod_2580 [Candidatus Symbiobacter mobilis CR]|uniref:Uncharacterized protein n=1 Tax=Candidatus Symbiobacter mobilis CR TaxID=946483 RepID=U5NEH9_9BURK|nr:hypothetical protein Cenrod_2580 [Candidatus Symbiobacter mobilis CR]